MDNWLQSTALHLSNWKYMAIQFMFHEAITGNSLHLSGISEADIDLVYCIRFYNCYVTWSLANSCEI